MSNRPRGLRGYYRRNLRVVVGTSAAPYGYTLATWTTGAVLVGARGIPSALAALTFMFGAVLGFAVVGAVAFGGVGKHSDRESGEARLVRGSFHFFSVGCAIGVSALVARYLDGLAACPLAGFLFTSAYLLVLGTESAAAYASWDQRGKRLLPSGSSRAHRVPDRSSPGRAALPEGSPGYRTVGKPRIIRGGSCCSGAEQALAAEGRPVWVCPRRVQSLRTAPRRERTASASSWRTGTVISQPMQASVTLWP